MTAAELAVASAAVAVGSCVQGAVGLGLGLLAGPILVLVDRDLVPAPIIVCAFFLTLIVAWRDRAHIDLVRLRWAFAGRVPGVAIGAAAVAALPARGLSITFAVLVLAAVAMSVSGWRVEATSPALFVAGAVSGVMGTASSIGGPPMALLYQRAPGPVLRGTLAGYFVVSTVMSLAGLAAFGELGLDELRDGLVLVPAVLAGFALSRPAARLLDGGYTRLAVLTVAAASSVVILVRELT